MRVCVNGEEEPWTHQEFPSSRSGRPFFLQLLLESFFGAKVWKLAARCTFWQTAEDWLIRNQAWFQVKQAEATKSS